MSYKIVCISCNINYNLNFNMLATVAFRIEGQFLWIPLHLHYHFLSNCGLNTVTSIYSWLENL